MRKNGNSRLRAGALALLMTFPLGTFAGNAFAQTQSSGSSAASSSSAQVPQPDQGGVNWSGVGYGAGSLATNILYIPAKLVYAVFGGLVGGGAWVLTGGNTQTANTIWRSSLGGDYVVTPDMLAGKEPIHFSGPTDTAPLPPDSSTVQPVGSAPANPPLPSTSTVPGNAPPYTPAAGGVQPMDRGAGSMGNPGGPPSTLPDTSIE
jgi:hypothetical protein